jgi:hypothetical protein
LPQDENAKQFAIKRQTQGCKNTRFIVDVVPVAAG